MKRRFVPAIAQDPRLHGSLSSPKLTIIVQRQLRLDAIHGVLTDAARTATTVRVLLRDKLPERPARIVEGVVLEVADGRDGRTRVRIAIPTGAGDPVEVRVLVESIDEAVVVGEGVPASPRRITRTLSTAMPQQRPSSSLVPPRPATGARAAVESEDGESPRVSSDTPPAWPAIRPKQSRT
jgi:hypothetical protein